MYLFCISCKNIVATIKVPTLVLAVQCRGPIYQHQQISENLDSPATRLQKEAEMCTLTLICLPLFLLIIDHISLLIYSFPHFLCIFSVVLFPLNMHIFTMVYTTVSRKRCLSPRFMDNMYSFFHGFWYTGLMTARKMGRNQSPSQKSVLCMIELLWIHLFI